MKIIQGDLIELALDGQFDVIIHGCNCFCTMGAGIAKQIKETFPEAYLADLKTKKGDKTKLGGFTSAKINGLRVINAYTQYDYKGKGVLADYEAIQKFFVLIYPIYKLLGCKIGYPKIGAGLAHGDWNIISRIIDIELHDLDHTLVELK